MKSKGRRSKTKAKRTHIVSLPVLSLVLGYVLNSAIITIFFAYFLMWIISQGMRQGVYGVSTRATEWTYLVGVSVYGVALIVGMVLVDKVASIWVHKIPTMKTKMAIGVLFLLVIAVFAVGRLV